MQVFYLIDFENVGVNGLRGIETVGGTDSIHLFSTNKGTKLDVKTLSRLNGKSITYHNVPQRKQSVDMHLVSYLGYLIGQGEKSITIVSEDTDYDNVISFWEKATDVHVKRSLTIAQPKKKQAANGKMKNAKPAATAKMAPKEKELLTASVMRALSKAGYKPEIVGSVASIVAHHLGTGNRKEQIHTAIVQKYGQPRAMEIYHVIRKTL